VRWREKSAATFTCPAVVHVRASRSSVAPDHFIACFGETTDGLCVGEFPNAPFVMSRARFNDFWDGDVLYIDLDDGTAIAGLRRARMLRILAGVLGGMMLVGSIALGVVQRRQTRRGAAGVPQ
jgi:hypothetical protein